MDDNLSGKQRGSISHFETTDMPIQPEAASYEDGYKMTKVTYLALAGLYWSWGTVGCMSASTTTISHQIAAVGGVEVLAWISNSFLVVQVALQAVCGSFGDHYGKRWVILVGSVAGIVGGIVAGRAQSIGQIIAGQVLFGVSCSMHLTAIPASQEIVPSRYRPLAVSGNQILIIVVSCVSQLTMGATVKYDIGGVGEGWRWSYYLPAIFNGVNFLLNFLFYRPPQTRIQINADRSFWKSLDLPGFSLFMAGLVLLTIALVWGGNMYSWSSAHTLASLVIGVVVLIIFGFYEWKGTNQGLLDHRLFENRNFAILQAVAFIDGLLLFGILAFVPQEVAAVFTNDAVLQVVPVVAYTITTGFGGFSAGLFLFLTKRYRIVLSISLLWMSLFIGLLALVKKDEEWMIYTWPALAGLGVGVTTTLPSILTSLSVPNYLIGTAVTLSGTSRTVGGIVGITIFSSVYNNKYNGFAPGHIAAAALKAGLSPTDLPSILKAIFSRNIAALQSIPSMTPAAFGALLTASAESSLYGYKYVYITIFPFCLLCAGLVIFLKNVDENMTDHVESRLEAKGGDNDKVSTLMTEIAPSSGI